MKSGSIEKEKIQIDFSTKEIPELVRNYMPDVYRDGENYICILGAGDNAIIGEGSDVKGAMSAWEKQYRLNQPNA